MINNCSINDKNVPISQLWFLFLVENNYVLKSDLQPGHSWVLQPKSQKPRHWAQLLIPTVSTSKSSFLKLPRDLFFNKSEFSKDTISSMKHSLITDLPNICLLNDDEINNMRNVFKEFDRTGDLTVNRKLWKVL